MRHIIDDRDALSAEERFGGRRRLRRAIVLLVVLLATFLAFGVMLLFGR